MLLLSVCGLIPSLSPDIQLSAPGPTPTFRDEVALKLEKKDYGSAGLPG